MAFGKRRARGRSVGRKRSFVRKPFRKMGGRKRARSATPKRMISMSGRTRTVTNSKEVPQFSSTKMTNVVSHREYIGDVFTGGIQPDDKTAPYSSPFTIGNVQVAGSGEVLGNGGFKINVGVKDTFPWLYNLARNYEQYRVHGMVFEFKSLSADALNSTNTALGSVIMATEYNAANPIFESKQQMENYEFAQSCKPSVSMMHAIECAPNLTSVSELYVRAGPIPLYQDPRLYDLGTFQIATCGMQAAQINIGELWCTYLVELIKPKIPNLVATLPVPLLSGLIWNSRTTGPQICGPKSQQYPNLVVLDAPGSASNDPIIVGTQISIGKFDTLDGPLGDQYGRALLQPGTTYRITASAQIGITDVLTDGQKFAFAIMLGDKPYIVNCNPYGVVTCIGSAAFLDVTTDFMYTVAGGNTTPWYCFLAAWQVEGSNANFTISQVLFEIWQIGCAVC